MKSHKPTRGTKEEDTGNKPTQGISVKAEPKESPKHTRKKVTINSSRHPRAAKGL